jgi:hypothetical protein
MCPTGRNSSDGCGSPSSVVDLGRVRSAMQVVATTWDGVYGPIALLAEFRLISMSATDSVH